MSFVHQVFEGLAGGLAKTNEKLFPILIFSKQNPYLFPQKQFPILISSKQVFHIHFLKQSFQSEFIKTVSNINPHINPNIPIKIY